ncbi:TonB-dependent receptor domain-containing protein [Pseudomonas cyclaminis]|uniref:TonB-dependent receptor domain-containing protein n=1 Tax=Pseudomonas cyclaminis TaxID=2781239 RepID=UPI003134393C
MEPLHQLDRDLQTAIPAQHRRRHHRTAGRQKHGSGGQGSLLDERLGVSAAVFKTEQQNVAEATSQIVNGQYVYRGVDYKSRGVELEANGEALPGLSIAGGYTYVHIEDNNGEKARQYVPTHSVRGSLTYRLPACPTPRSAAACSGKARPRSTATAASSKTPMPW